MRTTTTIVGVLIASFVATVAAAHPHEYVQPNAGVGASVTVADCSGDSLSVGGVCFDELIEVGTTLTITDDVNSNVRGSYCQDVDGSAICSPSETTIFCGSITLTLANFDPDFPLVGFRLGTVSDTIGNPTCGFATHGSVDHS